METAISSKPASAETPIAAKTHGQQIAPNSMNMRVGELRIDPIILKQFQSPRQRRTTSNYESRAHGDRMSALTASTASAASAGEETNVSPPVCWFRRPSTPRTRTQR